MQSLENQILEYLREHPNASDTLEGILQWWINDYVRYTPTQVHRALDRLVTAGALSVRFEQTGRALYRLAESCLPERR